MASDSFRSDPERAAQLAVYLAQYLHPLSNPPAPGLIARTVVAMQKAARSAKRSEEALCNYDYGAGATEKRHARMAKAVAKLNADLNALAASAGLSAPTVTLGGDPRGSCGTLHIPGQPGDGWGDGFAIY